MDTSAMFNLTYGLFIAAVELDGRKNACIINTAIQTTSEPCCMTVTMQKSNLTTEMILKKWNFSISIIAQTCPLEMIKNFGLRSGRECDKFADVQCKIDHNGNPYFSQDMLAFMSVDVSSVIDLGTHYLFVCKVAEAEKLESGKPMTYADYRTLKAGGSLEPTTPQPAKKTYFCSVCHYVYDGDIPFEDLPDDYVCPICGKPKSFFITE